MYTRTRPDWLVVAWLAGQLAALALLVWLVVLENQEGHTGSLAPIAAPTFFQEQQ